MLRPEQMSKVSVTGSKAVMADVVETLHDLNLVHLSDYDGRWEGFAPGTPMAGSAEASEKLVTVRSIESILDVDEEDVGPTPTVDETAAEERIEEVRQRVNELDDRRAELRDELREIDSSINTLRPFARLGIDLDLLSGYDSLAVAVGRGREPAIRESVEEFDGITEYETFSSDSVVAIFARPAPDGGDDPIADALVGVDFATLEIPNAEGSPDSYLEELRHRRQRLETQLEGVERELEDVKLEAAGFLLAIEERLSIEAQKAEAPLQFATTERSFIAEGWIPTERYAEMEHALEEAVGERVEIDELERAEFGEYAGDHGTHGDDPVEEEHENREQPPVIMDNVDPAKPFELIVNMVNRPKYGELDPTLLVFLTFPFAFGFMIGDIGYGILYMAMGWFLYRFDSEVMQALGMIALWAGVFTTIFGYLYDDIFGVHMADMGLGFLPLAGVLSKGLQTTEWALLWVVVSVLFGILHLNVGFVLGFVDDLHHGVKDAFLENLSWALVLNGLFVWIFSQHMPGQKPDFLVGTESVMAEFVGFAGFSEAVGLGGAALMLLGVVLVVAGEGGVGFVELPSVLANALSYLRITAVLLAKGGMAFAVNLLVFGAYITDGGYTIFHLPGTDVAGLEQQFVGLIHIDPLIVGIPLAIFVFVFGHILVLLLGITAAGIQMLRLEYVEFFGKFYEGGGVSYDPFGYRRKHTTEQQ